MKLRLIFLALIVASFILSCNKTDDNPKIFPTPVKEIAYEATGVLGGYDGRMCACCGGIFLEVDGDTKVYLIQNDLPEDFNVELGIGQDSDVKVKFNWTYTGECGFSYFATIDDIALLDD